MQTDNEKTLKRYLGFTGIESGQPLSAEHTKLAQQIPNILERLSKIDQSSEPSVLEEKEINQ